jgi:hypothetical protein
VVAATNDARCADVDVYREELGLRVLSPAQRSNDGDDTIHLGRDEVVSIRIDSEHEPTLRSEARVSCPVAFRCRRPKVAPAVSFKCDLERRLGEVEGVVADLELLVTFEHVTVP